MTNSRRSFLVGLASFFAGFATAFYALPESRWLGWLRTNFRRSTEQPESIEIDISGLRPGAALIRAWGDRTIYVLRRTPEMLAAINASARPLFDPESDRSKQPEAAKNEWRSIEPEIFVVDSTCTHLGCPVSIVAEGQLEEFPGQGFFCACHGAQFDLAGRVYAGYPAPSNLTVPTYFYKDESTLVIGAENEVA